MQQDEYYFKNEYKKKVKNLLNQEWSLSFSSCTQFDHEQKSTTIITGDKFGISCHCLNDDGN